MAKPRRSYILTETAADDFRAARRWSRARWGRRQTRVYFDQLHEAAEYIATHQLAIASRKDLTAATNLGAYPVGEHFLVYTPITGKRIAIVALIRQVRDVPAILQSRHLDIQRALGEMRETMGRLKRN